MVKILTFLFMLSLLCCNKDKSQQIKQAEDISPKPVLEMRDFVCKEEQIAMYKDKASCEKALRDQNKAWHESYLWHENYLKELEAKYEDIFKKPAPKCRKCEECGIRDRVFKIEACTNGLEHVIYASVPHPYPTIEEKIAEDEKVKIAYKKKFGVPITDFELSITSVHFDYYGSTPSFIPKLSVIRTAIGAFATSKVYNPEKGLELGMAEWLDFIMALRRHTSKWKTSYYCENLAGVRGFDSSNCWNKGGWLLEIHYLDKDGYIDMFKSGGSQHPKHPQNWGDFIEVINNMEAKIKKRGKETGKVSASPLS